MRVRTSEGEQLLELDGEERKVELANLSSLLQRSVGCVCVTGHSQLHTPVPSPQWSRVYGAAVPEAIVRQPHRRPGGGGQCALPVTIRSNPRLPTPNWLDISEPAY